MIRRPHWLPSLIFAAAIVAGAPAASAMDTAAKKTEIPALKTQAQTQANGRLRVVVELKVIAEGETRASGTVVMVQLQGQ